MRKGVVGNFVAFFSCAWYLFYRLKVIERPIPRYQVRGLAAHVP